MSIGTVNREIRKIFTRNVEAALDMLFVQYGVYFRVVSQRIVNGWIEIMVTTVGDTQEKN